MEETISESEEDNVEMDELPTLESELDGRTTLRQPLAVVSEILLSSPRESDTQTASNRSPLPKSLRLALLFAPRST